MKMPAKLKEGTRVRIKGDKSKVALKVWRDVPGSHVVVRDGRCHKFTFPHRMVVVVPAKRRRRKHRQ